MILLEIGSNDIGHQFPISFKFPDLGRGTTLGLGQACGKATFSRHALIRAVSWGGGMISRASFKTRAEMLSTPLDLWVCISLIVSNTSS